MPLESESHVSEPAVLVRAASLLAEKRRIISIKTDRAFAVLLIVQWVIAIVIALVSIEVA
jgi:hypothetical protein